MARIVIVHPEYGIFVGHGMGLCFFSLIDTAGQGDAVTFPNEVTARDFAREHLGSDNFQYIRVNTTYEYATCEHLREAGLGALLADMPQNALANMQPMGRC